MFEVVMVGLFKFLVRFGYMYLIGGNYDYFFIIA